jgi:hypothetical protein
LIRPSSFALGIFTLILAAPAVAGPPFITDDPEPTDTGHWEIYAFSTGQGEGSSMDGDAGLDLNYGPVRDVQLTATLPLSFEHERGSGWRGGTGDLELAIKYRFLQDEKSGVSAALFPRVFLPTSTLRNGERTQLLLPLWVQKDFGSMSLFGGGGYEINPGPGNRDFWQEGAAVTHDFAHGLTGGVEIAHQGPDSGGGTGETDAGAGVIIHLSGIASFLALGGPTWANHRTGYHFYASLGLNF